MPVADEADIDKEGPTEDMWLLLPFIPPPMLPPTPPPGKEKKADGGWGARPVEGFLTLLLLLMLPAGVRLPCFPPGGVPRARGGGRMGTGGPEAKGSTGLTVVESVMDEAVARGF
jgi:hypothetical protein